MGDTHATSGFGSKNTSACKLHAHFGYEHVSNVLRVRIFGTQFFFEY